MSAGVTDNLYKNLFEISQKLTAKTLLPDILNFAYDSLRKDIPFDRLCVAVADKDLKKLTAIWVRSVAPITKISKGYSFSLACGTLGKILETGQPRIINDLNLYLQENPESHSTRDILIDGIKSSLSFPLMGSGHPIGIIFFSSLNTNTYNPSHIDVFSKVATELSLVVEHAQLVDLSDWFNSKEQTMRTTIHDLRSPLGVIQGYLDLIKQDIAPAGSDSFVSGAFQRLEYSCLQMTKLLDDLNEVYASDKGVALQRQQYSMAKLIEEAVYQYYETARKKGVRLNVKFDRELPVNLYVDVVKIRRVLSNLIDNAIKYTAINSTIDIFVRSEKGEVVIDIADQGAGIPKAEMQNLFQEYGKTSVRPTGGEASTGLGLFISRLIVEAHNGKIFANSEPGKGSTFTFKLPLERDTVL